MNTSVSAVLYTSKKLSNGKHPLMIRLTKNRKLKYISLHVSLFGLMVKKRPARGDKYRLLGSSQ